MAQTYLAELRSRRRLADAAARYIEMGYTLSRRIETEHGLFTAIVVATPQAEEVFAEIRTHDCDSHDGAASVVDALSRSLVLELLTRGDVVLAIESPISAE